MSLTERGYTRRWCLDVTRAGAETVQSGSSRAAANSRTCRGPKSRTIKEEVVSNARDIFSRTRLFFFTFSRRLFARGNRHSPGGFQWNAVLTPRFFPVSSRKPLLPLQALQRCLAISNSMPLSFTLSSCRCIHTPYLPVILKYTQQSSLHVEFPKSQPSTHDFAHVKIQAVCVMREAARDSLLREI